MSEAGDDPGEVIADAIAEYLNEQSLSLTFVAEKPEDIESAYELERPGLTVLVAPFGEEASRRDRGSLALETFQTTVIVIRRLDNEFTRTQLARFTREIKHSLRGTRMAGHVWTGDETVAKYDPDKIAKLNQYQSTFRTNHMGVH